MISDVRRGRTMAVLAAGAALATALAVVLDRSPASAARGAVALPHADVACASCHDSEPAASACVGCHGPHRSARAAHRASIEAGTMGCTTCHAIHESDGGVRFGAETVRYAVGRSMPLAIEAPFEATVPLVPLARCTAGCHVLGADDPIERCRIGEGTLNTCFDEHRAALAVGAEDGVCADQHGPRIGPWEAARAVAVEAPEVPRQASPALGWLGWGGFGAVAAALIQVGAGRLGARRRRRRNERAAVALAPRPTERRRLPVIDAGTCLGCYACVDACPYDVLRIDRYVAVVERPEACCGLSLCEQSCPNGSLTMGAEAGAHDHPRIGDDMQVAGVEGLFLAGDVTGVPLIKSAILQGRLAAEGAAALAKAHRAPLDVLVIGAGPAGISAALRAAEQGLAARIIEQGTVAQSIKSFPRGKLVFDQPLDLPRVGKLWLERGTKEELLAKWLRVVREEKLAIDEDRRFVSLAREDGVFVVEARDEGGNAHRYRSTSVILAIGTRGTPRKLPIPTAADLADKVFYSLADARSFAGQRVLVVGLGDVAMETAIALAGQPDTEVTIAYRGRVIRRGKERNRREIERLVEAGRIALLRETHLERIERDRVEVMQGGARRRLDNDAVFVMIGNLPPRPLLEGLGVAFGAAPTEPSTER